ncbi:MAG: patatin-like phospholipase family protein [Alphaproteobacteria bacterium]|nr:patatin-like phospholipase family protein [Alphaproteobacteria bacterium]
MTCSLGLRLTMSLLAGLLSGGAAWAQDPSEEPAEEPTGAPAAEAPASDPAAPPAQGEPAAPIEGQDAERDADDPDPIEVTEDLPPTGRPTVGVALSGGGAWGLAHIGVLKAMEELHIPVDALAGTSMGGLIGGLYASGMSPAEIEKLVSEDIDWARVFNDTPARRDLSMRRKEDDFRYVSQATVGIKHGKVALPVGLLQGHRQNLLFKDLMLPVSDVRDFSTLPTPYRAIATDLDSGEEVVLDSGDLATAMRATMSVPGVFAPVQVGGRHLVDGGVRDNLPVDDARDMGATVVIASWVDLPSNRGNFYQASSAMVFNMIDRNSRAQVDTLGEDDALVKLEPPPGVKGAYTNGAALVQWGYDTTMAVLAGRTDLQLDDDAWAAWLASREHTPAPLPTINFIDITNESRLGSETIARRLKLHLGETLDVDRLERDIDWLYGMGVFEWVAYEVVEKDGQTGLQIDVREKEWGPNYISPGFFAEADWNGDINYALVLAHRRLPWNKLGGEWQNEVILGTELSVFTELYQPVTRGMRVFVAASGTASQERERDYQTPVAPEAPPEEQEEAAAGSPPPQETELPADNQDTATQTTYDVHVRIGEAGLDLGVTPFRSLELRAGYHITYEAISHVDSSIEDGLPPTHIIGQVTLQLRHDRLDDAFFPRSGTFANVEVDLFRTSLNNAQMPEGTSLATTAFEAEAGAAGSLGRHTLSTHMRAGSVFGDDTSAIILGYQLGGLFNLSGYGNGELQDEQLVFGRVGYRARLTPSASGRFPLYAGVTAEAGRVNHLESYTTPFTLQDMIYAGSVYLGAKTPLGPIYFAYGHNTHNVGNLVFYLGRVI